MAGQIIALALLAVCLIWMGWKWQKKVFVRQNHKVETERGKMSHTDSGTE